METAFQLYHHLPLDFFLHWLGVLMICEFSACTTFWLLLLDHEACASSTYPPFS